MHIGVLRTQAPFASDQPERLAASIVAALNAHGHEATEIILPFEWRPGEVQITLGLDERPVGTGELRRNLYQSGVGSFIGRSRAFPIELPYLEESSLRVVNTTPLPWSIS